jgi:hypothetical protein
MAGRPTNRRETERISATRGDLAAYPPSINSGVNGVSIGTYATALFVLGLISRLSDLTDVRHDDVGLDEERLPKRIRKVRPKSAS